jgi:hypothetical protein
MMITLHCCRHVVMDESAAAAELGLDMADDLVTVPMKAGDVLLFNNLIPHRSASCWYNQAS